MQQKLFHESIYDAMRDIVIGTGGMKAVGVDLWPSLSADKAGRDLADCLNPDNARTLDPVEMLWLLKRGRDAGIHTGMSFIARELAYAEPVPVDPETEKERLMREFIRESKASQARFARLEALIAKAA